MHIFTILKLINSKYCVLCTKCFYKARNSEILVAKYAANLNFSHNIENFVMSLKQV